MYTDLLSLKGKEIIVLDETFDPKTTPKMKGSDKTDDSKKYSNYDFRYFKEIYVIDEVLFVNLNWGINDKLLQ